MSHIFFFTISYLLLVSCVSTYTALQKLQPGLNKEEVRNTIGRPDSVGRSDGMDRWTYKMSWGSQKYTQDVFFDEGKVQKVRPLTPYPNYKSKMIEAESMEEYEINATLYQKQKEAGFREINSVKKRNNDYIFRFCANTFIGDTAKQKCVDIMRGKRFISTALQFCTKVMISNHQKKQCLFTISNKKFNPSTLTFCNNYNPDYTFKLKCLRNAGHTILPN